MKPKPTTWFLAECFQQPCITPIAVYDETPTEVILADNIRHPKDGHYHHYRVDRETAKQALINDLQDAVRFNQVTLDNARRQLEEANKL